MQFNLKERRQKAIEEAEKSGQQDYNRNQEVEETDDERDELEEDIVVTHL